MSHTTYRGFDINQTKGKKKGEAPMFAAQRSDVSTVQAKRLVGSSVRQVCARIDDLLREHPELRPKKP